MGSSVVRITGLRSPLFGVCIKSPFNSEDAPEIGAGLVSLLDPAIQDAGQPSAHLRQIRCPIRAVTPSHESIAATLFSSVRRVSCGGHKWGGKTEHCYNRDVVCGAEPVGASEPRND